MVQVGGVTGESKAFDAPVTGREKHVVLMMLWLCIAVLYATGLVAQPAVQALSINGKGDDFSPVFSADGTEMYYTVDESGKQRVMRSRKAGDEFGKPVEVVLIPSTRVQHIGTPAVSSDGQYMVFAALLGEQSGYGRTDLYSARKLNGVWTDVRNLGATVNSEGWDSQPSLSSDGTVLYFASDRESGKGGIDIYRCKRIGNAWSKAEPMSGVNTEDDEMSPSVAADGVRLYFCSQRKGGLGGYDVYTCEMIGDSSVNVKLMSAPLNSTSNEYSLSMSATGGMVCVSSDRKGGAGNIDIFRVSSELVPAQRVVVVRGRIESNDTNMRTVPWVSVHSLDDSRPAIDIRVDDETSQYTAVLQPGHRYAITSWDTDALVTTRIIDVGEAERGTMRDVGLFQRSVSEGTEIPLRMVARAEPGPDAAITHLELQRVADVLLAHPELKMTLTLPDTAGNEATQTDLQDAARNLGSSVRTYLNLRGVPLSSVSVRVRENDGAETHEGGAGATDDPFVLQLVKENK